ncbi:MAG: threonine synthase [Candidatus Marinimicrobia bacterium]|nr:threonine synthase [Candidatus Neomarinimicrobiota bacterium]
MQSIEHIRYISTNRHLPGTGFSEEVSFRQALFDGLAPDGGLYMPTTAPTLSSDEIVQFSGLSYSEVAFRILTKFLAEELALEVLEEICAAAYDFPILIETLDRETSLLYLDRGPTASFKDFAARFMALTMNAMKEKDELITVLVATSGDTGSAVGEAFCGMEGFRVVILYPEQEVSHIQRAQLERIGENVQTLRVDGQFDDCQRLVKQAFLDQNLASLNLTSSNSINVGRILPQIVYYFFGWANLAREGDQLIFSVPSGNFGNSLGCEFARRMGLPVERLILAVNDNDEFPQFLSSGAYISLSPSRQCISNAMNVGNPSNLARYFDLYEGHLFPDGTVGQTPELSAMKENLWSASISDEETRRTITRTFEQYNIMLDPHGAVGLAALQRYREKGFKGQAIVLETAHPGKFPDTVSSILGQSVEAPPSLVHMMKRPPSSDRLSCDYEQFRQYLLDQP